MYSQDNDDYLPHLGVFSESDGRWMYHVLPYLNGSQVFTDPKVSGTAYDGTMWDDHTSYGLAEHLWAGSDYERPTVKGVALGAVGNPSQTIALGDTGLDTVAGFAMYRRDTRDPRYTSDVRPGYYSQFRHDTRTSRRMHDKQFNIDRLIPSVGLCIYGFLDGHATALTPDLAFVIGIQESSTALTSGSTFLLWNLH